MVTTKVKQWTHLQVLDVSVRGGSPNFLHHGCHKVVSLKLFGAELLSAMWAGYGSLCPSPVPGDARSAEVVHTGQHDRLPEQVTADGTCQVLSQAAFGGRSSSHDGGVVFFPLQIPNGRSESNSLEVKRNRKREWIEWINNSTSCNRRTNSKLNNVSFATERPTSCAVDRHLTCKP